jgi:hypothetical protein
LIRNRWTGEVTVCQVPNAALLAFAAAAVVALVVRHG